jgi:methyltransferase (TIGR00027 family)
MREGRPSSTAAWVAACRSLGAALPAEARLADDPYGARFASPAALRLAHAAVRVLPPTHLTRFVAYMQVRTRALDDVFLEFVRGGGREVILLGAGYDCRAARFRRERAGVSFFEVDHPTTQAIKRARVEDDGGGVQYVAFDFEAESVALLPDRLAARGHDASRPTLTIWEGVTMYLTERAIEESVAAVRALGPPGSLLAMTYFERTRIARRHAARIVALAGEPWRFGWDPPALPAWLAARGFALVRDETVAELAERMLPRKWAGQVTQRDAHVAIARKVG